MFSIEIVNTQHLFQTDLVLNTLRNTNQQVWRNVLSISHNCVVNINNMQDICVKKNV